MKYQIRLLGYDPESDELDLLINADAPRAAKAIPVDVGVYIRRDFKNDRIVGAFIRGYRQFAAKMAEGSPVPNELAEKEGVSDALDAIVVWQREVGVLSHELAGHLGAWPPQEKLMQVLVPTPT
ncbi:MAG: hypothetical protein KGJ80_01600 [Chloroflexota bacterium]|nr:hypothetical protein [Chloroflexota bacterium]